MTTANTNKLKRQSQKQSMGTPVHVKRLGGKSQWGNVEHSHFRTFQRDFVCEALKPSIKTAVLTLPRGNGKSWLAGYLAARVLTPDDDVLFRSGCESVLCAASIEQARIVFRFARERLEAMPNANDYRYSDNSIRVSITHKPSNTKLRVIGSNGKGAMGLVNCPLVIADEPACWEVRGGELLHDAIQTAQNKPNSPLKAIYIGTLAPATAGSWWGELIERGTHDATYVKCLKGNLKRWDNLTEIYKCNPLTAISKEFKAGLKLERDEARRDARLKARFLSYRLNIPTQDEASMLLNVDEWLRACERAVPERVGKPIVAVDLGGGRSWSAAVALWRNGRCEALALAPGIPYLRDQERRDLVPSGSYQKLKQSGALLVSDGRRVPLVAILADEIKTKWGTPARIVCDRFRLAELQDCGWSCILEPRVSRWSEASNDIRALRQQISDGTLSPTENCIALMTASLSVCEVKNDEQGNCRLCKKGSNGTARDDVAAALVLACGAWSRANAEAQPKKKRFRSLVV